MGDGGVATRGAAVVAATFVPQLWHRPLEDSTSQVLEEIMMMKVYELPTMHNDFCVKTKTLRAEKLPTGNS